MITRFPSRVVVLACVAFILASVSLTLFVWRSVGGPIPLQPRSYEVKALFTNAAQLAPNADVRISGVNIGHVTEIRPRGLRTEATLSIDPEFAPLAGDVRAILRQKTLLGETFVALSQGSTTGPKMADGGTLPIEHVEDTQPLDRVLATLDERGRERLHELLVDTGSLLDGRAQDVSDAAGNMPTAARQLHAVMQLADAQRASVSTLVARTGEVLQTVGDEEAAVRELVRSGDRALSATAARDAELTATIRAAPALLRELRTTATAAERTAEVAAPLLRDLRPVAPLVPPAMRAIERSSPEIEALLRDLEAVLPVTKRSLPAAAALVNGLTPLMTQLQPAAQQITPMVSYIAAYRRELVAAVSNVGAAAQGRAPGVEGGDKRYLRTIIPLGADSLVGASRRDGSSRHNAYMAPGGLDHLAEGLRSSHCDHARESTSPAPPCREAGGWSFEGGPERYYQRLTERPVLPEAVQSVVRQVVRP